LGLGAFSTASADPSPPMRKLRVDATDVSAHLLHVKVTLPASPGPMTLLYPKWIPGEHGPTGPVIDVAGLHVTAGGRELAWRRDPRELFAFGLDVPRGARE